MNASSPLRIGIVVHSLNHNNIGRVYPFLRAFVDSGAATCTLIGWDEGGGMFPLLADLPWPIVRLSGPKTGPAAVRALEDALRGCDVAHCFKNREHFPSLVQAARSLHIPLVLDLDDWELGLYLEGVVRWPAWRRALWGGPITQRIDAALELERLARTEPDALVVNSRALQAHFGGQIVYTAADATSFDPSNADGAAFRAQHGLAIRDAVIGFLGTPHPHKGIEELLTAFEIARHDEQRARLLFVGVPDHNPYAARLRRLPGVVCAGYIGAGEYPAAYAACDIIAIPQRAVTEGIMQTPAKLILAMAAGRPIIASSVGDMPAILGDAGMFVPPENVPALANALKQLMFDPARRVALGEAARARFIERYTLDHARLAMLEIYRRAIQRAAGR